MLNQVLLSSQSEYWALFESNQFMKSSALSSMLSNPMDSNAQESFPCASPLSFHTQTDPCYPSSHTVSVESELYYPSPSIHSPPQPSLSSKKLISLEKTFLYL